MARTRFASINEIRPLRHAVLRKGQAFETTLYAEDSDGQARHYLAEAEGEVLAIASSYAESRPDGEAKAWRIRGMASAEKVRGKGYGSMVLKFLIAQAREAGVNELWCNARVVAFGFYEAHGFATTGDLFEIEGIGPHKVMVCSLA